MLRSRLVSLAVVAGGIGLLSGCPKGPDFPCPPCSYSVSKGKLSGTMNGGFPAPYPYKNLVVTLKTNDGVLHPFPVSEPSSFAADQSFDSLVTTTITSGVSLVSARWDDANGNPVTQDSIPFE